jgi:hypothetical protein
MFNLHIVQARHGDCLILECDKAAAPVPGSTSATDRATWNLATGSEPVYATNALRIPINVQLAPSYLVSLGLTNELVKRENLSIWGVSANQVNLQNLKEECQ